MNEQKQQIIELFNTLINSTSDAEKRTLKSQILKQVKDDLTDANAMTISSLEVHITACIDLSNVSSNKFNTDSFMKTLTKLYQ